MGVVLAKPVTVVITNPLTTPSRFLSNSTHNTSHMHTSHTRDHIFESETSRNVARQIARMRAERAAVVLVKLGVERAAVVLVLLKGTKAEKILDVANGKFAEKVRHAMKSTASMSKRELEKRFFVFGSLGFVGVVLLSLAGCVAVYKRSGQVAIGHLSIRSTGVFWRGSALCCEQSRKNYSPVTTEENVGKVNLTSTSTRKSRNAGVVPASVTRYHVVVPQKDKIDAPQLLEAKLESLCKGLGVDGLDQFGSIYSGFDFHVTATDKEGNDILDIDMIEDLDDENFPVTIRVDFPDAPNTSNWRRRLVLIVLFATYIGVSVGVPLLRRSRVSCDNGFFWEDHLPFAVVFIATKVAELMIYANDTTLDGQLSFLDFITKFLPSILGYADGYTDAVSYTIASSCDSDIAKQISFWMVVTYVVGVVVLQWVLVACVALRDPSHACLMKVVHMDALASCVTLPAEVRWIWMTVNAARTFGEDLPQAFLQTLFIVYVKKNHFMMLSVAISIGSSFKALYDATTRALAASGAEHSAEQEAFDRQVVRFSASGSHEELQKLLQEKGARFSLTSQYTVSGGITPLMLAVASKDKVIIDMLQQAGAPDPDMTPVLPSLPAAFADMNLTDVVRHIAAGADVNTRLHRGEGIAATTSGTPLHACCNLRDKPGAYELLVLLLRRRADPLLGDAEGDTPLAHARYFGAENLYELLDANGAVMAGPFYTGHRGGVIADDSD